MPILHNADGCRFENGRALILKKTIYMNKLHSIILMCLLSLVGISANAQEFHPCDANHDGTVDVADIAITANYILTGEYQSYDPYNGHEYVDLGLSVKWATCNVGAYSPEDYGDYSPGARPNRSTVMTGILTSGPVAHTIPWSSTTMTPLTTKLSSTQRTMPPI